MVPTNCAPLYGREDQEPASETVECEGGDECGEGWGWAGGGKCVRQRPAATSTLLLLLEIGASDNRETQERDREREREGLSHEMAKYTAITFCYYTTKYSSILQ